MGEEDEVKQGLGSKVANTAKEQGKEAVKKQGKKAAKKVASKFSKKFAQKAASASMKGPMMMLMLKVLVVILIIMAIIGIVMFVVAMPGMVMDKLKEIAKTIGNAIASWFGADSTKLEVDDAKIYEVMTYLEQMGYDLKGEGFITKTYKAGDVPNDKIGEWKADKENQNTGIIRSKADDSIVQADSLFIYNYLVSDNYVYTVKNFNLVTEGEDGYKWWSPFKALLARGMNLFGNAGNEIWGEGLIAIYHEKQSGGKSLLGVPDGFYGNSSSIFSPKDIKVSAEKKTMTIKRGHGNNVMVYSLDGWTGRYGMPLEFLLSVHLATKMPDLAYDMTQVFGDTEVQILLHPLNNVSAITALKKDFNYDADDEDSKYMKYQDFVDLKGGTWNPFDNFCLSTEEAQKILEEGIESPSNCTGVAKIYTLEESTDNGDGWITDTNYYDDLKSYNNDAPIVELENLTAEFDSVRVDSEGEDFKLTEAVIGKKDKDLEYTPSVKNRAEKEFGYTEEAIKNGSVTEKTWKWNAKEALEGTCKGSVDNSKEESTDGYFYCSKHTWEKHPYAGSVNWVYCKPNTFYQIEGTITERTWEGKVDGKETEVCWVTYRFRLFKHNNKNRDGEGTYVQSYFVDYIQKYKDEDQLRKEGLIDENGNYVTQTKCHKIDQKECCENCRRYVKKIMSLMKDGNDESFKTYTPYISKVVNHWYRDVAFVGTQNDQFIQQDQEYEAIMGERWTLYETNEDNGQYILYELDSNGDYKKDSNGNYVEFKGTQQEAFEKGIAVAKKAETITVKSKDNDGDTLIGWEENAQGTYSAYKLSEGSKSTGWEKLYSEEEINKEEDVFKREIMPKIDVNITSQNDIVQVEEGQRKQTNSTIKKLFLNNTYFKYDGSPETADVIEALRKKISPAEEKDRKYGALTSDDLKASVELDLDEDGKKEKYEAKDYAGKVELTQDSLAAFSMLENTHTLDADFIYKDFKELVVELGYFTKEELTDETPRIFAWLIPEIGSYGFPIASLDKKENEFGTQVHSKADYEANMLNSMQALIASTEGEPETPPDDTSSGTTTNGPETPPDAEQPGTPPNDTTTGPETPPDADSTPVSIVPKKSFKDTSTNIVGQVASLDATPMANLKTVGAIKNVAPASYKFEQTNESPSKGTKTGELTFNGVNYECWHQTGVTCTLYSFAFVAHAYTGETFESYIKEVPPYWAPGLAGNAFDLASVEGTFYNENIAALPDVDECAELISGALAEGKPVYFYSGFQSSAGRHAIVLLGANASGKILYYDPWPGIVREYGAATDFATNLTTLLNTDVKEDGGHLYAFFIPEGIPEGTTIGSADYYEGFVGGEAVVSPVTGILLEYGTYQKGQIDPLTEKESRINVDFKYMDSSSGTVGGQNDTTTPTDPNASNTTPADPNATTPADDEVNDIVDYVGYAKIMILDDETYMELENQMKSTASKAITGVKDAKGNQVNSLVDKDGNYLENRALKQENLLEIEDANKKWSEDDITLYGYKEFAELYSDFGVSGNIIYIDGFKCQLPGAGGTTSGSNDTTGTPATTTDPNATTTTPADPNSTTTTTNIPTGVDIDLQHFIDSAAEDEYDKVMYEEEDRYNLSSKDASNKLNNENQMKAQADPIVLIGSGEDQKILIKEGTIIGRTMSNDEVTLEREKNGFVTPKATGIPAQNDTTTPDPNATTPTDPNATTTTPSQVIGNYLRIIMRDDEDNVVENVEEYMRLDREGTGNKEGVYGDLEAINESSTDAEKVRAIISYFKGEGFTTEAAAGIVGNLIQESALDASVVSDSGYTGLAQWSTSWFPKQKEWMESNGYNSDSFAGQVRSIYESGHTGGVNEAKWEELKGLTDVRKAAELFCVYYEACVGGEDATEWYHTGNKYQHLNQRKKFAQNALDIYMGDDSKGIKDM